MTIWTVTIAMALGFSVLATRGVAPQQLWLLLD